MKATIIRKHGEADVLEYLEWPDSRPGPGEVLVRVRACALNHRDIWVRRGLREKRLWDTGNEVTLDLMRLFAQNQTIHGTYVGTGAEFFELLHLVSAGRLRPVVDRVFPLAEAAAAHRRMERGDHFGKIVLSV